MVRGPRQQRQLLQPAQSGEFTRDASKPHDISFVLNYWKTKVSPTLANEDVFLSVSTHNGMGQALAFDERRLVAESRFMLPACRMCVLTVFDVSTYCIIRIMFADWITLSVDVCAGFTAYFVHDTRLVLGASKSIASRFNNAC